MLRECIKNKVFGALSHDIFRYEDFTIVENDGYKDDIQIWYSDYYFRMEFESSYCQVRFSPGKVLIEETINLELSQFEDRISIHIHNWLNRIKRDMLNPIEKRFIDNKIQEFREAVESKFEEIEDNYFTKAEGDELRERLEQLEKMISEMDSQEELKAEILKMREELEFLKATIDTLTKKKWFKNALLKFWSWGQKEENRKLIESGVEVVKTISQMDIPKL